MTLMNHKAKQQKHVKRSSPPAPDAGDRELRKGFVKEWKSRLPYHVLIPTAPLPPDEAFAGNNASTDTLHESLLSSPMNLQLELLSEASSASDSANDPGGERRRQVHDSALACRVRDRLMQEFNENMILYDENDFHHFVLEGNQHIIKYMDRFRSTNDGGGCQEKEEEDVVIDKTVEMMKSCLRWRKDCTLSSLNDLSFPIEFYRVGGLFIWTTDCFNNRLLVFRLKMYQKISELKEGMEFFTAYLMFKAHDESVCDNLNGWSVIFDLTDVTMAQCDLPQLFWLINTFLSYYPKSLKLAYVYNLPWIFKRLAGFILNFVPKEWRVLVKFVSGREIQKFVPEENLPDYMGGTCKLSYRTVPEGARPVYELAFEKYGMNQKECDRIMIHFRRFLE